MTDEARRRARAAARAPAAQEPVDILLQIRAHLISETSHYYNSILFTISNCIKPSACAASTLLPSENLNN